MARTRVDHARLVDELHAQLTERFEQMTTSREWFDYLATARRFHRYSPQNQLLLALQGADGYVAGYRNWQRVPAQGGGTCQVAKGAVGLSILAPLKAKTVDVDETTGEETTVHRLRGFRTVKVFHQGQLVAPPDIGDAVMPELLTGENRWQHVWAAVVERLETNGYNVALHTRTPVDDWNGMTTWSTKSVLVAGDLEPPQRLKTLLHEWAHVELAHDTRTDVPTGDQRSRSRICCLPPLPDRRPRLRRLLDPVHRQLVSRQPRHRPVRCRTDPHHDKTTRHHPGSRTRHRTHTRRPRPHDRPARHRRHPARHRIELGSNAATDRSMRSRPGKSVAGRTAPET